MNETDPAYKRKERIFIPVVVTLALFAGWYIFSVPLRARLFGSTEGESHFTLGMGTPTRFTWSHCRLRQGTLQISSPQSSNAVLEIRPSFINLSTESPLVFLTHNNGRHSFSQCLIKQNTLQPDGLTVSSRSGNRFNIMRWWDGTLTFDCQENGESLTGSIKIRYCTDH